MQLALSESQELLRKSAREFFAAECPITEARRIIETPAAYDVGLWRRMTAQGWMGIPFSEKYDGMGLGIWETAVLMEEMGRALIPGPYLSTQLLAGMVIESAGSDEHKEKYLAPICRGDARATVAVLETAASWEPSAIQMTAQPSGAGFVLCGKKLFVTDAAIAEFIICVTRIGGGLALIAIDRGSPGLTIERMPALDATRPLYAITLTNVAIAPYQVLARDDRAHLVLARALDFATVGLLAEMVGGMQRILEITVDYARTRKQFGRPIGQFQAVQHQCADMYLWTESSRSAVYGAIAVVSENLPNASIGVSVAKIYAGDAYRECGNRGIQVHGGMGFTWENDLHLYYRRAKASETLFGDGQYHRERIARAVVDRHAPGQSAFARV